MAAVRSLWRPETLRRLAPWMIQAGSVESAARSSDRLSAKTGAHHGGSAENGILRSVILSELTKATELVEINGR